MTLHRIISILAVILLVIDMIWFAVRMIRYKADENKKALIPEKGFLVREILIYVSSAAISVFCFFIDFGLMGNAVLNACAVIATEIANRQWMPS